MRKTDIEVNLSKAGICLALRTSGGGFQRGCEQAGIMLDVEQATKLRDELSAAIERATQ